MTNYIVVPFKRGYCLPMFAPRFMRMWGIYNRLTGQNEQEVFFTRSGAENHLRLLVEASAS